MCEERRKVFEKLKTCMNGNLMEVYSSELHFSSTCFGALIHTFRV